MTDKDSNSKPSQPLSTQGYRGTRDFYPQEQRVRAWVYTHIHTVMRSFGYEEYDGPFVEPLELYANKTSEEIVREQLYSMQDRGERWIAIRPEMTPTLARMVAAKYAEMPRPIRWYSIPTCMRYERPQRGRLREFDQLNVDVFGGVSIDEDVEVISTAVELLLAMGANLNDFEIRINHRGLVNFFLYEVLEIPTTLKSDLLRLLDKRDKMNAESFAVEGLKLGLTQNQLERIERFMASTIESVQDVVGAPHKCLTELVERIELLRKVLGEGSENCIQFRPDVMRGFDYYTGLVFEVYDVHPDNRRALFGGGRYENLVGSFGVDPLPGIGYGAGDVALINFAEVHNLIPKDLVQKVDVCVLRFSENDRFVALDLATQLRRGGLKVTAPLTGTKFGKQIQQAEKLKAKCVAFRGDEEIKNNTFCVKWLATGQQETVEMSELGSFVDKCEFDVLNLHHIL